MELKASARAALGKGVKTVRKEGDIPAEFYGRGMANQTLAVRKADFLMLFKDAGENTVITLLVGDKKYPSLIYDVQHDPVSGEVVHVDFYGVHMDEKIRAAVPIEFTGEAPAVKEKGGIVTKAVSEVEVESLPGDLPHSLVVDLSGLVDLNQSIYIKDMAFPKNVKVLLEPETVVVTVAEPAPEEEIAPPVTDVADVKVEAEEKKAERDSEKEAETNV